VGTPAATGAAPTQYANPGALAFSGAESGLQSGSGVPYPPILKPAAWTVSLWFRPASTFFEPSAGSCGQSGADGPGAELLSAGEDYAIRICRTSADGTNHVRLFFRTPSGKQDCLASNTFIADGSAWHHVAATSNGTVRTIFLDGVAAACTHPAGQPFDVGALTIARHFVQTDYDYAGAIDEVRIYNRPLALAEVQSLRQGQHPPRPATRHLAGDPLVVTNDLVVASRTLDLGGQPLTVGGRVLLFGGSVVGQPPPPADAAPDAPPDSGSDARDAAEPVDLSTGPDVTEETGLDTAQGETPDALADAGASDRPGLRDAGPEGEDAGPALRRVDLDVGCACDTAGAGGGPPALLVLAAAFGAFARRRRRR
jgi:MYXO-CTERM domain-containing protein